MPADPRTDQLFGNIALNWRLISRDLLSRALHYQRTQEPNKQLGEILLEKGVLTREQVNEILNYQQRIQRIRTTTHVAVPVPNLSNLSNPGGAAPPAPRGLSQPGAMSQPGGAGGHSYAETASDFSGGGGATATALGPTPSPDQDPLLGQSVGGCVINAKIGAGGMGAIYLAHHQTLRKDVVVKILPPESAANPRTGERFFREARAAAMLEHPNVVAVQDVGTTDRGLHYIIMQYIDGQNLEEKIATEGKHTPERAVKIVLQVASGLKAAHSAGVIHRDIKAENILITTNGTVKVTDFGLAKDLNSELKLTADGAMIGTPLYMAPEIGRVKEIDGRVDIYSLGVTFYYLLTGIQPFRGFSALEILSAKAHDKLDPPEKHCPEIADIYRNVVGKMLEKDRDVRYSDIDQLIRDLEALERGFPLDVPEPSVWPPRGTNAPSGPGSSDKDASARMAKRKTSRKTGPPAAGEKEGGISMALVAALIGAVLLVVGLVVILVMVVAS